MKTKTHQDDPHLLYPIIVTEQILKLAKKKNLHSYNQLPIGKWICARPIQFGCVLIQKPRVFNSKSEALKSALLHNANFDLPKEDVEALFNQVEYSLN